MAGSLSASSRVWPETSARVQGLAWDCPPEGGAGNPVLSGQEYVELGAQPDLTGSTTFNDTTVFAHDISHDAQTQAGALPRWFGSKIGRRCVGILPGRSSPLRVGHPQADETAQGIAGGGQRLVHRLGLDQQVPAVGHGVTGVQAQVEQHLGQRLPGRPRHGGKRRIQRGSRPQWTGRACKTEWRAPRGRSAAGPPVRGTGPLLGQAQKAEQLLSQTPRLLDGLVQDEQSTSLGGPSTQARFPQQAPRPI